MHTLNLTNALTIFEDHLVDIRKACVENAIAVGKANQPYAQLDVDNLWTIEAIRAHVRYLLVDRSVKPLLTIIKRIDSRKRAHTKESITDEHIARAKEVPIEELYDGRLFGGKTKTGVCPFHEDCTPSFTVFEDNRFKCFGCQVYGTAIDYVMLRDGVDFVRAVKTLSTY